MTSPDNQLAIAQSFVGPLLQAKNISKTFGAVRALRGVDLDIYAGEIHFIMGENGAGKSTLINILGGNLRPDAGEILIDGQPMVLSTPALSQSAGIAVIHQELSAVPCLSAIQNIVLGREPKQRFGCFIDRKAEADIARSILAKLAFSGDPDRLMHTLSTGQQQMVEIAKALSLNARIIVMDEPTASISESDCEHLYEIVNGLREHGVAILYISHRMKEFARLADRATILRDGVCISSMPSSQITQEGVIKQMVGRNVDAFFRRASRNIPGEILVQMQDVTTAAGIRNITLDVKRGEIVGLAGLVGSGRTEIARAIFGADRIVSGKLSFMGEEYRPTPVESVRRGIAFVPEDRKGQGLAMRRSIGENLALPSLKRVFPRGVTSRRTIAALCSKVLSRLRVATPGLWQTVGNLSGGNQQKIVFGKWLPLECELFIIDEPTRGIDVGAKSEILAIVEKLAAEGKGVLMISSELPEIIGICDRIYVIKGGEVVGALSNDEFSEEAILEMAVA